MPYGLKKVLISIIFAFLIAGLYAENVGAQSVVLPEGHWIYRTLTILKEAKVPLIDEYYYPGIQITRYDMADLLIRLQGTHLWPNNLKEIKTKLYKEFAWEIQVLSP